MTASFTPMFELDQPVDLDDPSQLAAWCEYLMVDCRSLMALLECVASDDDVGTLLLRRPNLH